MYKSRKTCNSKFNSLNKREKLKFCKEFYTNSDFRQTVIRNTDLYCIFYFLINSSTRGPKVYLVFHLPQQQSR